MSIFLLLFFVPVVYAVFYYWKAFQTFFNPPSLFLTSFMSTLAFSHFVDYLSEFVDIYGWFRTDPADVTVLYLIGFAFFMVPWVLVPKRIGFFAGRTSDRPYLVDFSKIRQVCAVLAAILVVTLGMTFVEMGGIPVLSMFAGTYSYWDHVENLRGLPLGLMSLNLIVTFTLILYVSSFFANPRHYQVRGRFLVILMAVLLLSASWQGNRQIFLMLLFFIFARRLVDRPLREGGAFSTIRMVRAAFLSLLVVALFAALFILFGVLRLRAEGGGDPFDLLVYFSWPVYNMMAIIQKLTPEAADFFPHYLLSEILPARFGGKDRTAELSDFLFEPSSPSGYFAYWFLDFGYGGVAVGALLLGSFSRWAFLRRLRDETSMRIYLLALWCCATAGIYSHFISINYFLLPLLVQVLVDPIFGLRRFVLTAAAVAKPDPLGPVPLAQHRLR